MCHFDNGSWNFDFLFSQFSSYCLKKCLNQTFHHLLSRTLGMMYLKYESYNKELILLWFVNKCGRQSLRNYIFLILLSFVWRKPHLKWVFMTMLECDCKKDRKIMSVWAWISWYIMSNWHVQDMRALVKYCLQDNPYLCSYLSLIRKMMIENPPC